MTRQILQPGHTCWRVERANRFSLVVDAADYFHAAKQAMEKAQHTIMLIGWDFDTRIRFNPGETQDETPDTLGEFVLWLAENRPGLDIFILKWDLGVIKTLTRSTTPVRMVQWALHERIHFQLDGAHPAAAAHHQKVVVIDDALAFCGGIDMTADRWDTSEHRDDDPRRRRPFTRRRYGPWHDATAAVDGAAARALGDHARERWRLACGEDLTPPPQGADPWPDTLPVEITAVDVAIARTAPAYEDRAELREIEALYLAGIAAARRQVYFESQYFASRVIAEAIAARLEEPDGPEFVLINPETADGWLEEEAMGSARARLLAAVEKADRHGRFRILTPVTAERAPIYVHAKIMIVDDRLLRVGSSNLNNRSMGYDTECDVAIEAAEGDDALAREIAAIRCRLLGEHLGHAPEAVAEAVARTGSLIAAIESLMGAGRSLVPFVAPQVNGAETYLAEHELLDPERPTSLRDMLTRRGLLRHAGRLRTLLGAS
jgi:phospholipase D1/2